jgi:hypothetical protein
MAKKPAEPFVNVKLHGITVPDASRAVSTPTFAPGVALLFMVKLLMLIVMSSPRWIRITRKAALLIHMSQVARCHKLQDIVAN